MGGYVDVGVSEQGEEAKCRVREEYICCLN